MLLAETLSAKSIVTSTPDRERLIGIPYKRSALTSIASFRRCADCISNTRTPVLFQRMVREYFDITFLISWIG